jgi:hypothetical protein
VIGYRTYVFTCVIKKFNGAKPPTQGSRLYGVIILAEEQHLERVIGSCVLYFSFLVDLREDGYESNHTPQILRRLPLKYYTLYGIQCSEFEAPTFYTSFTCVPLTHLIPTYHQYSNLQT